MAISTEFEASYIICSGICKLVQNAVIEARHDLDLEDNSPCRVVNTESMCDIYAPHFK